MNPLGYSDVSGGYPYWVGLAALVAVVWGIVVFLLPFVVISMIGRLVKLLAAAQETIKGLTVLSGQIAAIETRLAAIHQAVAPHLPPSRAVLDARLQELQALNATLQTRISRREPASTT